MPGKHGVAGVPVTAVWPDSLLCSDSIELDGFSDDWSALRLDDDALVALQLTILANPRGGPPVRGTGGLRKLRFAPPTWRTGKRGAVRVCYVYFAEVSVVLLVTAYGKNVQEDLSEVEKRAYKKVIERIRKDLKA
jgi:hypothetical protein